MPRFYGLKTARIKPVISQDFDEKIQRYVLDAAIRKFESATNSIEKQIADLIERGFKGTRVYRGLRGKLSEAAGEQWDLQAEFGLTDGMKADAIQAIIRVLRGAVELLVDQMRANKYGPKRFTSIVRARVLNPNKYKQQLLDAEELKYYSNSHLIHWISWLLQEKITIPGYTIGYGDKLKSSKMRRRSRSGRALMFKTKGGSYTFSKLNTYTKGNNFVDEIALDDTFQALVAKIVKETFQGKGFVLGKITAKDSE